MEGFNLDLSEQDFADDIQDIVGGLVQKYDIDSDDDSDDTLGELTQ